MLQKAEGGGYFQYTEPIRAGCGAREKQKEVKFRFEINNTLHLLITFGNL